MASLIRRASLTFLGQPIWVAAVVYHLRLETLANATFSPLWWRVKKDERRTEEEEEAASLRKSAGISRFSLTWLERAFLSDSKEIVRGRRERRREKRWVDGKRWGGGVEMRQEWKFKSTHATFLLLELRRCCCWWGYCTVAYKFYYWRPNAIVGA